MVENFSIPNTVSVQFDPYNDLEIAHLVPTTESQIEIWLSCLLGGDDACRAFNESITLRFEGMLDKTAMELALRALVLRHDALRSVFSADGKHVCVLKELPVDLLYQDISSEKDFEKKQLIDGYVKQEALHLFNLVHGPLFKTGLLKVSEQEYHLVLTAHHIIWDGWSKGVMVRDLSVLYSAYMQNIFPDLPKAPSFSKYAIDQYQLVKSEKYRKIESFWLDQYKSNIPQLNFPIDFPRPAFRTFKSKRQDYLLDAELGAAVRKLGQKAGCSYVTTLIATFEILLYRLTGQDNIVLGLPAAGQSITDNQHLVGHCVNLLPLRSNPKAELSFLDFLKQRQQSIFEAYEHQQLTFGSLLKKLTIFRDPSRVPIVPVVMNVDMSLTDGDEFYGLRYELIGNPREYENFELFLNINNARKALTLECSYNTQLFKAATIDRMMGEFEQLLKVVVDNPYVRIGDIQLTNNQQIFKKLAIWNSTKVDYPRYTPLHKLIALTSATFPDKIALLFNNYSITYKALDQTANQLAWYILKKGIKSGDIVGVALDRSPEMLIVLLAVMKSGVAYLPLDTNYPQDRVAFMLTDSSATMLITSRNYYKRFHSHAPEILIEDVLSETKSYPVQAPDLSFSGDDLAYVLYTSGSTGKPKGVLVEHHSLVNLLYSMITMPGIKSDDVLLAVTTISFDIAGLELYLPLLVGATIVMADTPTARDGRALLDLVKSKQVSIMQATPATWQMMLNADWDDRLPLKVLCGGEALPKDLAEKLIHRCAELWNVYGPTETTIWSTIKKITDPETISIGRPINNTQVFILDKFSNPMPEEIVGEIYIGGDGVARGYLNRPELTNEKFVRNPFDHSGRGRLYRTGDLGKFTSDGEVQCLGRADHQIKIRGYRIELGEIEYALHTIADIKESVVEAHEDRPGNQRLVAYVVPKTKSFNKNVLSEQSKPRVSKEQIQDWKQAIRRQLPDYMVPENFIILTELPLTPSRKIDRKALPKFILNGIESQIDYVEPRNEMERLVAAIWKEVVGLDKINIYDNFFEIGGHSLSAIQIMNRLEKETGKRLPPAALFKHSSIEKLAKLLPVTSEIESWNSLVLLKAGGNKIPLYIVHGVNSHVLQFHKLAINLDPNQPVYGLQARGINGLDEPLNSIEAMASYYIAEIINKNPDGPFAIAGLSFGGIVAYEMNKQLINMGKQVKFLGLFDTYAFQSNYYDSKLNKLISYLRYRVNNLSFYLTLFAKDPQGVIEYKMIPIKRKINKIFKDKNSNKIGHETTNNSSKMQTSYAIASREYRLTPQQVTIELFRAKRRRYYVKDTKFLGWKPFALNGINVNEIPGEHGTLFNDQNVKEFARILQKSLDDCQ